MPKGVACSVSNCVFWDQGNRCVADEITIEIDAHGKSGWYEEFAEDFESHQDKARNSSATCCLTFRPHSEK